MKRVLLIVLIFLMVGAWAAAGGQGETGEDDVRRNTPQAVPGYEVRFSGWWNGNPFTNEYGNTFSGQRVQSLWDQAEAKHSIKLSWIELASGDTVSKLTAGVMAGDPVADVMAIHANSAIPQLAMSGVILPLEEYFDFNDPKWPDNLESVCSYDGHVWGYFTKADSTHGVWYNRTLLEREGLPDPYELQEAGEWTWDAYLEIAQTAQKDTDGDGETDQYGIAMGYPLAGHFIFSNGGKIVDRDGGSYTFAANRPEAIEALDFVGRLWQLDLVQRNGEGLFISGKAALFGGEAWAGKNFKNNMQDEVGFVFYPKGPRMDEYTSVTESTVINVIPANGKYPPEKLAQIIEDITPWDIILEEKLTFLEANMMSERDIETALRMMKVNQLNVMNAFPGLSRSFWRMVDSVKQGTSAATAVQERTLEAEQAIDALFSK